MPDSARILVIEDNEDLAFGLRTNMEVQGYVVALAEDGEQGLELAEQGPFELIILDLMLPRMDGIEVLRRLRKKDTNTPVLVLTAKGNEVDKVTGLRLGADDYVTKPFGLMELMARIEALLRRATLTKSQEHKVHSFGTVRVETESRRVTRGDEEVELTPKEYGLLLALIEREGAVASRIELMSEIWGHSSAVVSRTVDTHVAELRRKLEKDPSQPQFIMTVRKTGYRLDR